MSGLVVSWTRRVASATAAVSGTSTPAMVSDMTSALSVCGCRTVSTSMLAVTMRCAPPSTTHKSLKSGQRNRAVSCATHRATQRTRLGGGRSGIGAGWFQPLIACNCRSSEPNSSGAFAHRDIDSLPWGASTSTVARWQRCAAATRARGSTPLSNASSRLSDTGFGNRLARNALGVRLRGRQEG